MAVTRIPEETLATLRELAAARGESIQAILAQAVEAYRRACLLDRLNVRYAALRRDAAAWRSEMAERAEWDYGRVRDGGTDDA